jgi:cytochrome c
MKKLLIAAAAVATVAFAGAAQANEALAKDKGCLACHAVDAKKMGPALKEVSAKLKGKADAEATIVGVMKSGKATSGKSHPVAKASDDEMKALAKWVLSL